MSTEVSTGDASPGVQRSATIVQDSTTTTRPAQRDADYLNSAHTEPPPHPQSQLPLPPQAQVQAPGALTSPAHQQAQTQLANGHAQQAIHPPLDAIGQLQQFAQWASSAIEDSKRDMLRLGNAMNNIEKDIRNFNVLLTDMRNEVLSRPSTRDITALRSEIQVLRESRNDAANGMKGQKLGVDEFEVLTENMSRISEKANAVDDIKMQLDFLKSRTKRLEEVTRGIQSLPGTQPTPGSGNSPQTHVSPFVPSMNHGLPTTLHGPLSGRDGLPNQVAGTSHTTQSEPHGVPLIRKREGENANILPSIPTYPGDDNELPPQKRYKYTNPAFAGEQPMGGKEYRSLAAQPNLGAHEARTFVMTDNGDFKPSHLGFVADPLTPKPKPIAYRGGGRGRGRGAGNVGREMGRVSQYSPQPQDSVERPGPYQNYEGVGNIVGTRGGEWLGSNPAVSAARTNEPYLDQKSQRRNSEGVVLTKNGKPDGRSIKRRPIQRNSEGIPVTRSGKPDGRFLAARTRKQEDQSQSPAPSNGMDGRSDESHRVDSVVSQEVATPTPSATDQLIVVEKESTAMSGDASVVDLDGREELVPVTPVMTAAPVPIGKAGSD